MLLIVKKKSGEFNTGTATVDEASALIYEGIIDWLQLLSILFVKDVKGRKQGNR